MAAGFDPEKQKRKPGLTRMCQRLVSINGQLSIDSGPDKGTRITVSYSQTLKNPRTPGFLLTFA